MDKFEQFFRDNRLGLDTEELDHSFREEMLKSLGKQKKRRIFRFMYVAASLVAIIALSFLLYQSRYSGTGTGDTEGIFPEILSGLVEQEAGYIRLINSQVDEIRNETIPVEYEGMFQEFIHQLEIIDKQYEMYKNEVVETGYNEELVQQIIYNYQLKLSVLQMFRNEINKINKLTKNKNHEYIRIQFKI